MSKIMLVNVTHVEESRVATLDDGVLTAYEIETINRTNVKGNIYNAVVEGIHPSLEAAFVKIGSERKGFLPLDEVNFNLLPARTDSRKQGKIGQHLHPGQKIMAQVVREPFGGKPPTISTYFSLPGRFLVLMPGVDSSGVSRKIEDGKQRDRLSKLVKELNVPDGFGVIVRTAGMGQTKTELNRDLRYLLRLWESIQKASKNTDFPGLVYREADVVIRTIRDHYTSDINEVWIDSEDTYARALDFVRDVMPTKAKTLKLHTGDRPLFSKFNLEDQIEKIYMRRVPLPSGGEIVIDGTEALTAIDVNTARSRRKGDAEDNALQANVEAAAEIARQLRLRDQGGLIVVDFIDMAQAKNRSKLEKAMRDAMKGDKAKYDVTRLSKLGLMEIARQRLKGAKMAASYATCPVCAGHGLIKNVEAAALAALRKLQARRARADVGEIRMMLPPEVAVWVLNHKRADLLKMEERHRLRIRVEPSDSLLRHEVTFEGIPRDPDEELPPLPAPPVPQHDGRETAATEPRGLTPGAAVKAAAEEAARDESEEPTADEAADEASDKPAPRRRSRRGRRRGGSRQAEGARAEQDRPAADEAGDKVVPFPSTGEGSDRGEDATAAGSGAAAKESESAEASASGGEQAAESEPRRRRRRRRRRGRGGDDEHGRPETPPEAPAVRVPQNVRSDELMPAAVGGSKRRGRSGNRKDSNRGSRGRGGRHRKGGDGD